MKYYFIALSVALVVAGCATVGKGTTQKVPISSDPPGAEVTVDGIPVGRTPMSITLSCASGHSVLIRKPGYADFEQKLTQSVSGYLAGNIIAGGLVGVCVDASTGGMYDLTPESVSASLVKLPTPTTLESPVTGAAAPVASANPPNPSH